MNVFLRIGEIPSKKGKKGEISGKKEEKGENP